jgi:hypothetical protein
MTASSSDQFLIIPLVPLENNTSFDTFANQIGSAGKPSFLVNGSH